jgi:glycine/D-amino acid oxidase-like deaminating enzyme
VEKDGTAVVTMSGGKEERAKSLVLTAGCWTQRLVSGLTLHPHRAVLCWFEVLPEFVEERRKGPGFMLERKGEMFIYGFPASRHAEGWLLKCAGHYAPNLTQEVATEPDVDPDNVKREVAPEEVRDVEKAVKTLFRGVGKLVKTKTCLYNNSHDCDFVIDRHPDHANVLVASGFSGHGFKFSITIGKILAGMARGEKPEFDMSPFRINRPGIMAKL